MTLRVGSLCSGYGGLELGLLSVVDAEVVWHVENDKHPSAVLAARFPGVPNHGDVKTTKWSAVEPVDLFAAGYPCQPESFAGKGLSEDDPRWLWPDIANAIGILRPRYLFLENVAGHFVRGFRTVLGSLASIGYDAQWTLVRASDAGAPHRRERLFILASDARRERHGRGEDGSSLGRMARTDAGEARERQWSWPVASDRGATPLADVARTGQERHEGSGRQGWWAEPTGRSGLDGDTAGSGFAHEPDGSDASGQHVRAVAGAVRRDRAGSPATGVHGVGGTASVVAWGVYEPAIRRWERVTGRVAPDPKGDNYPRFVEWHMGLPGGWVTDILPRNPALKCLGNGVVPQQAALALRLLLPLTVTEVAA